MVRMKVFKVDADGSASKLSESEEVSPIENFIALIGYDNIKNIIVSAAGSYSCYYAIFYEDGKPYTPYTDPPKKKGLFG